MTTTQQRSTGGQPAAVSAPRIVYFIVYVRDLAESRAFYEQQLGLRLLEEDDHSAKYDAGLVMLLLNRASDHGVTIPPRDDSAGLAFLVEDPAEARAALERRGVRFASHGPGVAGLAADFYDPNGHRLCLYGPHDCPVPAETGKLRAVREAACRATPADEHGAVGLDGKPLVCWFFSVAEAGRGHAFYHGALGLRELPSRYGPAGDRNGARGAGCYDGGGLVLASRPLPAPAPSQADPAPHGLGRGKGIAPVFHVADLRRAVADLSDRGLPPGEGVFSSRIGLVTSYRAPSGHSVYLYEPSAEALHWPSAAKIKQILTVRA
jgi:catechol 2,3-dioxygenase-like lactoylglutathione lyase family enzyme